MINGYLKNDLAGSGMVVWKGRELYAAGEIDKEEFIDFVSRGYGRPSYTHERPPLTWILEHRRSVIATQWERHRP